MSAQISDSPSRGTRFNVFKVRDGPVISDPDVPGKRYHTVIFIETESDGCGQLHHVTGDLVVGMKYETKLSPPPEDSETFFDKEFIGTLLALSYPKSVDTVCRALRVPPPQKAFNSKTMRTEQVKPDGTFYDIDEKRPALFKCTEWVEQLAIPSLLQARVIERTDAV